MAGRGVGQGVEVVQQHSCSWQPTRGGPESAWIGGRPTMTTRPSASGLTRNWRFSCPFRDAQGKPICFTASTGGNDGFVACKADGPQIPNPWPSVGVFRAWMRQQVGFLAIISGWEKPKGERLCTSRCGSTAKWMLSSNG